MNMILFVLIGSIFKIRCILKLENLYSPPKENQVKHYDIKPIFSFLDMQTCIGKRYKNNRAGSEVMCSED